MKLPFTFGTRLIFRLLLPGLVLALYLYPAAVDLLAWLDVTLTREALFALLAVPLGWAVWLLDTPIYMLFEGRRYWPPGVATWATARQAARLKRSEAAALHHREEERICATRAAEAARPLRERERCRRQASFHARQRLEAELIVATYPLNGRTRLPEAPYPTRLGNILAEYETYPTVKYGLDGVFYWYRIWLGLPKDLRDELDDLQASLDGALYVAFACYVGGFLLVLYRAADSVFGVHILEPPWGTWWWLLALLSLLLGYAIYRAQLPGHIQYGNYFKAMFDRFGPELKLEPALAEIAERVRDPRVRRLKGREAGMAVWRYLRWDRVRLPGEDRNRTLAELREQGGERI